MQEAGDSRRSGELAGDSLLLGAWQGPIFGYALLDESSFARHILAEE
jgi:hypothetical protein